MLPKESEEYAIDPNTVNIACNCSNTAYIYYYFPYFQVLRSFFKKGRRNDWHDVMTRLMGLFLGAIAVGFISDGIWNIYQMKLMG